jgi:hypothetical protein
VDPGETRRWRGDTRVHPIGSIGSIGCIGSIGLGAEGRQKPAASAPTDPADPGDTARGGEDGDALLAARGRPAHLRLRHEPPPSSRLRRRRGADRLTLGALVTGHQSTI